jgi:hypothetical protein
MTEQTTMFGSAPDHVEPNDTLSKAKRQVEHLLEEGSDCPCCGQMCKLYPRPLHAQMAAWLIWLVREHVKTGDWVDVKTSPVRGGDYAKLVYWGLVKHMPKDESDTKRRTSGMWKPTFKGILFAKRKRRAPDRAFVFNNQVRGFSDRWIDVVEALGKGFDFEQLWYG